MKNKITYSFLDKEGIPLKPKNVKIETFVDLDDIKRFGITISSTIVDPGTLESLSQKLYEISQEMKNIPEEVAKKIYKRTIPSNDSNIHIKDKRKLFIMELLDWCKNDQEKMLSKLREYNFVFLDSLSLLDMFPEMEEHISPIKLKKYQWMLKVIKWSANPQKDIYDPYVIFGVQILPKLGPKVIIYLNKRFWSKHYFNIKQRKSVKPKEVQLIKYPEWMTYEERNKWGKEHRRLITNKKMKPSAFYERHNQDIIVMGDLILPDINNGNWEFKND